MFTVASSFRWLFLVLIISHGHGESEMKFDGATYVTYSYTGTPKTLPDDILLAFKTIKPSGILFHAVSSGGDFITLELLRGKIRYSIYTGSMRNVFIGYLGKDLADNRLHQVEIRRSEMNGANLNLYVDLKKKSIKIPGFYSNLFARQTFYLGGVDVSKMRTRFWRLRKLPFVSYEGCFMNAYVVVNGLRLLNRTRVPNTTVSGKLTSGCNIAPGGYDPITFSKPESFIKVIAPQMNTASYSFKFRTYDGEGMLLYQRITDVHVNSANIFISLVSGRVKLEVEFSGKSTQAPLHLGSDLDDGMWHSVAVNISIRRLTLKVDNDVTTTTQSQSSQGSFVNSREVFVGKSDKDRLGFVGCMRDLTVQGQNVNFTTVFLKSQVGVAKCSLLDFCVPSSPCRNGGRCSQRWNRTICDCSGTDFKGPKCETPAFFMQSCADWFAAGKRANTYYKINPQHSQHFTVYCNMTNVEGPSTVIFHTQDRNKVIAAKNKIDGSYHHEIFYDNSKDQNIKDLIASSTHCRQYLQYKCYNSVLFDSPKPFNLKSGRGARWVSRGGQFQDYWSGAPRGSLKCACGVNRTCVESDKVCNCDTADNKWHMDDGYLTDPGSIPVKKLIFSVNGTSARSYYVLGSLECYGSTTVRATTTDVPPIETLTTLEPTASKSTKHETKSPSTSYTITTSGKGHITKTDSAVISTPSSTLSSREYESSKQPDTTSVTSTSDTVSPSEQPDIVVIEAPRKYITIRENANQQLVLIILSVILAVFVIAIIVLIMKQNLFFPCKCLKAPLYHDVRNLDTVELGPPSPAEAEILQFEASPYPARNYDIVSQDCHVSPSPELYSDAETDRLDISNGSSTWNSENADIEKQEHEKQEDFEDVDLGLIDVLPFPNSKQLNTEQQIMKLKEVIYDVLTAADVTATYSDKNENTTSPNKRYKDSTQCKSATDGGQSLLTENEQLVDSGSGSTATISEISSEIELFSGEHSSKIYSCNKETDREEGQDEPSEENTMKSCKPLRKSGIAKDNWHSGSDLHDNYLSLDVDNPEDGTLRQPLSGTNLNSNSRLNEQSSCDNNLSYPPQTERVKNLPDICDGKRQETKQSVKEDKRKQSSPRPRLFSRQNSEKEALLSSAEVDGLNQNRSNRFSDRSKRRYSGIANSLYQQQQQQQQQQNQQQQYPNANENQPDVQFRDRKNKIARAMPRPKQTHLQKYETEL